MKGVQEEEEEEEKEEVCYAMVSCYVSQGNARQIKCGLLDATGFCKTAKQDRQEEGGNGATETAQRKLLYAGFDMHRKSQHKKKTG